MPRELNAVGFEHTGKHGTKLTASRCDFKNGVTVIHPAISLSDFASDIAEIIAYHAMNVRENLTEFAGYDCITWHTYDSLKRLHIGKINDA